MRRPKWLSFVFFFLLLALASCKNPVAPMDDLQITPWTSPWGSSPCGLYFAPAVGGVGGVTRMQQVDCTSSDR